MTRLYDLRKRLARLRRRRQRVRWGTGYSAVGIAVLWVLAVAFLIDWRFETGLVERLLLLVLCAGTVAWAVWRFTLPWLGHRESDLDMALLVEQQEHIDSDLIAAVEFESPEAPEWGSVQLENAVIDYMATTSKRLNVMRGLSRRELARRLILLVLTVAVWALLTWGWTGHVSAFFNRFLLFSSQHYPTDTIIETVQINGCRIDPAARETIREITLRQQQVHAATQRDGLGQTELGELAEKQEEIHKQLVEFTGSETSGVPERPLSKAQAGASAAAELLKTNKAEAIDQVVALQSEVLENLQHAAQLRAAVKCRYGRPLDFEVTCSGAIPGEDDNHEVRLTAVRSALRKTLILKKQRKKVSNEGQGGSEQGNRQEGEQTEQQDSEGEAEEKTARYEAGLAELREGVYFQFYLGDAWTDSQRLDVTELPVVEVNLEVVPPPYADAGGEAKPVPMPTGLRQISVIEGSRVLIKLHSDKRLSKAALSLDGKQYESVKHAGHAFRRDESAPSGDDLDHWILDSKDTPLFRVTEPVRYSIQVTDQEGQQLERPIEGVIRIRADAPPRIAAGIVTRYVVPDAEPRIYFQAVDEYGLARVSIQSEVVRVDGRSQEKETTIYTLKPGDPLQKKIEDLATGFALDLSPFDLAKGDTVTITLRATDFRGWDLLVDDNGKEQKVLLPGKSASSEALVFQVTDEQGILAAILQSDKLSARQLKAMILRQLGIGESP